MKRLFRTMLAGGLVVALAGCTWLGQTEQALSGTIEAEELPIVAEVGGQVTSIGIEEGSHVTKGEVLAEIDKRSYQMGVAEAQAALEQATVRVEEAKAGSRDVAIQKGLAGVQQADANIHLANARKSQADAGIVRAQQQLAQSKSQQQGAQDTLLYQQRRVQEAAALFAKGAISKKDLETQQEAASQAQTQLNQLNALVAQAEAQVRSAQEDVAAAIAQTGTAQAQQASAQADLELLKEGSTDYTIRALLAAQQQAQTRLDQAKLQLEKAQITASADGVLLRFSITQGEVAKVGATLFTMMKADKLKLVVYIPEAQLNRVQKGQEVGIQVDAYLDVTFKGKISTISDKAEFTPKNVQTPNERTKLVFAVTIHITEGLDKLKPGMPAEILLSDQGGAQ